jgi:hypothetical protein
LVFHLSVALFFYVAYFVANLNSLLTGLSGLDVDTIMMFQISEADQKNLDDEVELAMKEILANSVPLEEFKLATTG